MSKGDLLIDRMFRVLAVVLMLVLPLMVMSLIYNILHDAYEPAQLGVTIIVILAIPLNWYFGRMVAFNHKKKDKSE